jgi:hypothetical protein
VTAERRDPQTGREIEAPDVHAGKPHALLAGLDCLHDTSQVFAARDMSEIRSWLIHMAREESTLLRLAFDPTAMDDDDAGQSDNP